MKAFERLWIGILSISLLAFSFQTASAEPITVVSWGGSYGKAQDRALFTDASNHSGIAINRESGASMTKTCLQVQSGSVTWDLVVTGSGGAAAAAADGCLEKIDYSVVDVSDFYPGLYTDYCVGSDVFATVMAWNTDKYGGLEVPVLRVPGPIFGMSKNSPEPGLTVQITSMVRWNQP